MPPKKGMSNRRGTARRGEIVDAAVELFAQRGYRGGGLLELAERVRMSHVGILHHFGTKENLLRAVMARRDQIIDQLASDFQGRGIFGLTAIGIPIEPPVLTRLATVLRAENLDPGDPLHGYFDEQQLRTRAQLAAELRRSQERGEIRSDIDPDVKAVELVAFGTGIETLWLLNPGSIDRKKIHQSFLRTVLDDLTKPGTPRRRATRHAAPPPQHKTTKKQTQGSDLSPKN